jgi:hypothetical protein
MQNLAFCIVSKQIKIKDGVRRVGGCAWVQLRFGSKFIM